MQISPFSDVLQAEKCNIASALAASDNYSVPLPGLKNDLRDEHFPQYILYLVLQVRTALRYLRQWSAHVLSCLHDCVTDSTLGHSALDAAVKYINTNSEAYYMTEQFPDIDILRQLVETYYLDSEGKLMSQIEICKLLTD